MMYGQNNFEMWKNGFMMPPFWMPSFNVQNPQMNAGFPQPHMQNMNSMVNINNQYHDPQNAKIDAGCVNDTSNTSVAENCSKSKNLLDPQQYKNVSISEKDLEYIVAKYGDNIDTIYELNPGEKLYYAKSITANQMQLLQFTWLTKLKITPAQFRLAVNEMCNKMDNLRIAYAYKHLEHPYKVLLKKRAAEIVLVNGKDLECDDEGWVREETIQEVMERDRVRGFDLEDEPLLRITAYKLARKGHFLLIFSQPHINTDGTTLAMFMKNLLQALDAEPGEVSEQIRENKIQNYEDYLGAIDRNAELEYWKEYFDGFEDVKKIPGCIADKTIYEKASYSKIIPQNVVKELQVTQGKLKVTAYAVLQSVWALLLGQLTESKDVSFGTVVAGRDFNFLESMRVGGELSNIVPLRVRWKDDDIVGDLVTKLQKDFLLSVKNSHCSINEIMDALGRKAPIIDHVLNYENLPISDKDKYSPDMGRNCKLVRTVVSISSMANLNILFFNEKDGIKCEYQYNANSYTKETIEMIAGHFEELLELVAQSGTDIRCGDLPEINKYELKIAGEMGINEIYKRAAFFKKLLKTYELREEELLYLANNSPRHYYSKGEVIIQRGSRVNSVPIVIKGYAETYLQNADGWDEIIAVLGAGQILSFAGYSEQPSMELIMASSDDTEVIFIPVEVGFNLGRKNQKMKSGIFARLEKKYIGYAKLWLEEANR